MNKLTEAKRGEIRVKFAAMANMGMDHCFEVYPEKGDWEFERVGDRVRGIAARLDIIASLARGEPDIAPNDDGSPRTLTGEFAKLACSVMILGDLLGNYEEIAG